jgi:hypothetical protein
MLLLHFYCHLLSFTVHEAILSISTLFLNTISVFEHLQMHKIETILHGFLQYLHQVINYLLLNIMGNLY